jgi:hypothetical protein
MTLLLFLTEGLVWLRAVEWCLRQPERAGSNQQNCGRLAGRSEPGRSPAGA